MDKIYTRRLIIKIAADEVLCFTQHGELHRNLKMTTLEILAIC